MINPLINNVLRAFLILLEGDKQTIGNIELIKINSIKLWCSSKLEDLPLQIRERIAHQLSTKSQYINYLKSIVDERTLAEETYRTVAAHIFHHQFENPPNSEYDENWVRLFVFLFNLSKKLPQNHIDHELLIYNASSELIAHFEDGFELMAYEGYRVKAQLSGLYFSLKIYEDYRFYNWRFFPLINQLIAKRFILIRSIDPNSGKVSYKNPQHYLFS